MILGWDQARPPDPPNCVAVDVTTMNSVTVRIQESVDGPISTKYKSKYIMKKLIIRFRRI